MADQGIEFDAMMYFEKKNAYGKGRSIPPIVGECLETHYKKLGVFHIKSFKWGVEHSAASLADAGAQVKIVAITKDIDQATPQLYFACCTGAVFNTAHIFFRKTGGEKQIFKFIRFKFGLVQVTKWELAELVETVEIRFNSCKVKYQKQTAKGGKAEAPTIRAYNFADLDKPSAPQLDGDDEDDAIDMQALFGE